MSTKAVKSCFLDSVSQRRSMAQNQRGGRREGKGLQRESKWWTLFEDFSVNKTETYKVAGRASAA